MLGKILRVVLGMALLAGGVGAFFVLKSGKRAPERHLTAMGTPKVETVRVSEATEPVTVAATGVVVPARSVTLLPQVSGAIQFQDPRLVPGGRIPSGEVVVRIDPEDYELAVSQQRASVTRAKADLESERAQATVAEQEWRMIRHQVKPTEAGKKLALREVQVNTAKAALSSARSGLSRAKLDLRRTEIRAPFNALVLEESVDQGQVVSAGTRLATLVDADLFWVRVSVPADRLGWIAIPGISAPEGEPGARVRVFQRSASEGAGGEVAAREGRVVGLLGDVDPAGKMARLLVEVRAPLSPIAGAGGERATSPLLLGSHVQVEIEGPRLEGVVALPRGCLRDGDRVWVLDDGALAIRDVDTVWTRGDTLFVRGGLHAADEVVSSRIAAPVDGMALAKAGTEAAKDEQVAARAARAESATREVTP